MIDQRSARSAPEEVASLQEHTCALLLHSRSLTSGAL